MPGQHLVESELVERLGVSRALIRGVLATLAHEGLVDKEPHRGARVRTVGESEAIEITECRSVLEGLAARHAAVNATAEDREELSAIQASMERLLRDEDLIGYSNANSRLHARILTASRHATLQRLVASLRAQTIRFQYRTILTPGRPRHSLDEHAAIVGAINSCDPDEAERAMRRHLSGVATALADRAHADAQAPSLRGGGAVHA